jgi:plasmid stabilization system protein ParE
VTRRRIEFDERAKAELRHAREWYASKSLRAAVSLEEEVMDAMERLAEEAHTLPLYDGEMRRILLATYPYGMIFEIIGDVVFVVVFVSLKREPGYWKK